MITEEGQEHLLGCVKNKLKLFIGFLLAQGILKEQLRNNGEMNIGTYRVLSRRGGNPTPSMSVKWCSVGVVPD